MLNAKQKWEIKEAIEWVTEPAEFKPSYIKEPIFPDEDMHIQMGHATVSKLGGLIFYFNNTRLTAECTDVMLILFLHIFRVQFELVIQNTIKCICYRILIHILHLHSLKFNK